MVGEPVNNFCPFCRHYQDDVEFIGKHILSDHVVRLQNNPIIHVKDTESLGGNVNGPSLIRVPTWIDRPLGKYYLYFAHHSGEYIRLAYADYLEGPWHIYDPGTLHLDQTPFDHHIASPDVHIDHENKQIRMYFHGRYAYRNVYSLAFKNSITILRRAGYIKARRTIDRVRGAGARSTNWDMSLPSGVVQHTSVAHSHNGIHFSSEVNHCGMPYFRAFRYRNTQYALAMPGVFYKSSDGYQDFDPGPVLFSRHMRHAAVQVCGDTLRVFYSRAGDCPERILLSEVKLHSNWWRWTTSDPVTVLKPEREYEGSRLRLRASDRGASSAPVREVRDPDIFTEDDITYLVYSVAGEQGLAIAQIIE